MLTAAGLQFQDWTDSYRLFSKSEIDHENLFNTVLSATLEKLPANQKMIIVHMDDTIIKKTGKEIPQTAWLRDPLGPPFRVNITWGQRYIQLSVALPDQQGPCQSRAIPITFKNIPTLRKPSKKATAEEWENFKEKKKQFRLSLQGIELIKWIRHQLDQLGYREMKLCICVDGSYTNSTVLKNLPHNTFVVGRTRMDAILYKPAPSSEGKGRKKVYGERVPTPEQIKESDEYKWQIVTVWAAGKKHKVKVKYVKNLKWRSAGEDHTLQLLVIQPLRYRKRKGAKFLYRKPAYLICTDNNQMELQEILQAYIWRWEIEVNIRDEKTLLGCGQAQVRNPSSVANIPAFVVAMYSFLLLAHRSAFKDKDRKLLLPRAKWYPAKPEDRFTTGDLINQLRAELWAKGRGGDFSDFLNKEHEMKNHSHKADEFTSAALYSRQ